MRLPHAALLALPGVVGMGWSVGDAHAQAPAASADAQKIFEQAFGKRRARAAQRMALPTTLDGRELGTLDAEVTAQGVRMARKPLAQALRQVLRPEVLARVQGEAPDGWLDQAQLAAIGIEARYSAQRIAMDLVVPLALRAVRELRLDAHGNPDDGGEEGRVTAERWSLLANWRWAASQQSGDGTVLRRSRLFADGAARAGEWVLESNGSVATDGSGGGFERYETRVLRDWPDSAVRFSLGDVSSAVRPGLGAQALGGLRLSRYYGLNPALNSQSQPSETLGLPNGGSVDVQVNGFVVRTLRLAPGIYNLRDIPVFNGANDVVLRVLEPGGRVEERRVSYFFDSSLLAPGLSEWDLALGVPVQLGAGSRAYSSGERALSAWWRRGWTPALTAGAGLQWRNRATGAARILQAEATWAVPAGTLAAWAARSQQPWGGGHAVSLQWRASTASRTGARYGASVAAQVQRTSAGFAAVDSDRPSASSTEAGLRAGLIWGGGWGATVSLARRHSPQLKDRSSSETLTLRRRLGRHWSAEFAVSRARSGTDRALTTGFVSLRYSGETSPAGTSLRGALAYQSQDRRTQADLEANGVTTLGGGEAPWRVSATRTRAQSADETALRGQLFTGRGELTWAATQTQQATGNTTLQELTLASGLVVSRAGLRLAAPVVDSAAVLVPRRGMEGLRLVVDPQRERAAAASDSLGAPVLSDLIAYSPRQLQLDAENLPPGRSLGIDRPLLLPAYRSVLLVSVGSDANTQVRGQLLGAQQQTLALQALRLQPVGGKGEAIDLFTNRRGGFMSPPLRPGRYLLVRPGEAAPLARVEIGPEQSGVVDLGGVTLKEVKP
ncbi:MAG: hypothetical protein KF796_01960 [Ramlibacter sp.]|nr:hypothetical protein [Ramlibacter sp.]